MPGERGHADQFVSLLDFDLSISSPLLSGDSNQNKESSLTPRICFLMEQVGSPSQNYKKINVFP
jgi:hypothetical protein